MTFADQIIEYNNHLHYTGEPLPANVRIMNPFREKEHARKIAENFYRKYYDDNFRRHLILGINPGRFGAGFTGVPFTDTKRLSSACGITYDIKSTHEPSSVFVYDVINAYGGAESFYRDFFINSVCPLGFVSIDQHGKEKNYNYYDSKELTQAVTGFIIQNIKTLLTLNIHTDTCICFGTGKNETFLRNLNDEYRFFERIVALEHPRFIVQYKSAEKEAYINKYLETFNRLRSSGTETSR